MAEAKSRGTGAETTGAETDGVPELELGEAEPQAVVTVEIPVELMERARESRRKVNELIRRGKDYWGEAGELEVIHLELLALIYGD